MNSLSSEINKWLTSQIKNNSKEMNELIIKPQVKKKRKRNTNGQDKKMGTKKTRRTQHMEWIRIHPNWACHTSS